MQLGAHAQIYVNDAFGTAHRAHASTEGITKHVSQSVAGFLLQKELDYLDGAVSSFSFASVPCSFGSAYLCGSQHTEDAWQQHLTFLHVAACSVSAG